MVKMKNVLSIDIDYVNNVHDFKNLLRFYTKIINKVESKNIIFSQIHANIWYILNTLSIGNDPIEIVNIDNHHDVEYDKSKITDGLQSSNWLGHYLKKSDFIKNVYWVNNSNSIASYPDDLLTITKDLNEVLFDKFDYLFVCESPHYTSTNELAQMAFETLLEITMLSKGKNKMFFYRPNIINHISRTINDKKNS